mgnify:CR=1 FL=1
MFPMMFIAVNQAVSVHIQINLLLIPATNIVLEPTRYNGNTICISGPGDVNVSTIDPIMVNITDTDSK